jgi:hypothetical protein
MTHDHRKRIGFSGGRDIQCLVSKLRPRLAAELSVFI